MHNLFNKGEKMQIFKDDFGYSRVIQTQGTAPATAWKLDNSKEIATNECRIALDKIHIEGDAFQQLCSECGHDDEQIKRKIMDILDKRGKLHNPFTKTGGLCTGTIEEMGIEYKEFSNFKEGDHILVQTTLTALPMHIDEILEIDYNYGQITVKGYLIAFMQTIFAHLEGELNTPYNIAVFDEIGSITNIYSLIKGSENILIIGRDLISAQFFSSTLRMLHKNSNIADRPLNITVVMDKGAESLLTEQQVHEVLHNNCDNIYIVDLSRPVEVFKKVCKEGNFDFTINCEDMRGSEVFSVLATKDNGRVYFTTAKSRYTSAVHVAESMCKNLNIHSFDPYDEQRLEFVLDILRHIEDDLIKIDNIYRKINIDSKKKEMKKRQTSSPRDNGKTGNFIFASKTTEKLVDETINVASYDCNVIIQGETGVGKEMVLGLLHNNSDRRTKPCVRINCATIAENLAESEFFGYESGAFTGAQEKGKKGYFEIANGGILFLDEVGQLSLSMQSKLLRVLQENQFYRVGGTKPINVNVRVVCANNIPLKKLVEEGKFREDLYYRFNICTLNIPPLRERLDDIPVLATYFLDMYSKQYNLAREFKKSALESLMKYKWPGNVRELENTVHRILINSRENFISDRDVDEILSQNMYTTISTSSFDSGKLDIDKFDELDFNKIIQGYEKELIEYALKKGGSTRKAASILNMTQAQLMRKKQKYEIQ